MSNAEQHCGKRFVLNLDLLDFFPTIHIGRVIGAFKAEPFNLPDAVGTVLGQLVCDAKGVLPQGAATSPIVANLVCRSLDTALQSLARDHCCIYTRYADDLSLSTTSSSFPEALARVEESGPVVLGAPLLSTIHRHGFEVNPNKVWIRDRRERQEVTGLTVNEFLNVRRQTVRDLRAILHNWEKLGYDRAADQFARQYLRPGPTLAKDGQTFRRFVHGRLAYLRMIRGEHDPVYRRFRAKLHFIDPEMAPPPIKVGHVHSTRLRGTSRREANWESVVERCRASVFQLQVDKMRDGKFAPTTFGTAFAYKRNVLATAGHNLENANVRVGMPFATDVAPTGTKHRNVLGSTDCGVIRVPRGLAPQVRAMPTQERIPEVGEEVAAIGYPYVPRREPGLVMLVGTVTAISRSYQNEQFIQVSFHTGGGLSGAPLVDRRGYVLGIIVESVFHKPDHDDTPAVQYGQAIPLGYLHYLTSDDWTSESLMEKVASGSEGEPGSCAPR